MRDYRKRHFYRTHQPELKKLKEEMRCDCKEKMHSVCM